MSKMIPLRPDDYVAMPWKNGLGTTTELAICRHKVPTGDSPFLWRISIAGVSEDGPFSIFPNVDRNLMLISGNGITLDGGSAGVGVLFKEMQVYSFPGDIEVNGKLADGPILDLNLMVDRRFAIGELSGFYVGSPERIMLNADVSFIHLLDGSAAVTLDIEGELTVLKGGHSLQFSKMNTGVTIMPSGAVNDVSAIVFVSIDLTK
jgi:uncharacterized protein|tara:strand:+ start:150774 stop:151388 length:615 start_codon:yes stop_codon:yes gene_type:complete